MAHGHSRNYTTLTDATFAIGVRDRYDDPVISACLPAIYEARRIAPDLIAPIMEAQRIRRKATIATLTKALEEQGVSSLLTPFEIMLVLASAIDQGHQAGRPLSDDFLKRLIDTLLR
jgi:hypothetical protein